MANKIKIKRSGVANAAPTAGDLEHGELALNYADGQLYFKDSGNVVNILADVDATAGSFTGNVSAPYFIGNGSQLTGISGGGSSISNGTSNVSIPSSGGNVTAGVNGSDNIVIISTSGLDITGRVSATGNITGGNLSGTNITGTLATASQPNITSVGTLGSLSVTGNVSTGNVSGTTGTFTTVIGNANASTLTSGTVPSDRVSGSYTGITGVGTLTAGTWTANSISTTYTDAKVTSVNGSTGAVNGLATTAGNLSQFASTTSAQLANVISDETGTGNLVFNTSPVLTTPNIGAATGTSLNIGTGNVTAGNVSGTLTTASQPNITSVGTLGSLTVTGNVNGGNIIATGTIQGSTIDSVNADLAEKYIADAEYPPGTVVIFGGGQEITQSTQYADPRVAGVISTSPAYTMNSNCPGQKVALQGRVPCRVIGVIHKGDLITSSDQSGAATRLNPEDWVPGVVIGKALASYNSTTEGIIEVVVGRL